MSMASLSASLLARKGQAKPSGGGSVQTLEELLGTRPARVIQPASAQKPVQQKSAQQNSATVKTLAPKPAAKVRPDSVKGKSGRRIAKTLRLDSDKSYQLRLLAARLGVSQQTLMQDAVEKLLEREQAAGQCVCGAGISSRQA